jgi:hypothetical protein
MARHAWIRQETGEPAAQGACFSQILLEKKNPFCICGEGVRKKKGENVVFIG